LEIFDDLGFLFYGQCHFGNSENKVNLAVRTSLPSRNLCKLLNPPDESSERRIMP